MFLLSPGHAPAERLKCRPELSVLVPGCRVSWYGRPIPGMAVPYQVWLQAAYVVLIGR